RGPRQEIRQTAGGAAVFSEIHHRAPPSNCQMTGDAQVPAADFHEQRIALRRPDRREVTDGPDGDADQPEAQAEAHSPGQRAVHDGDGARSAAEQDMLGQRPVDRDGESRHRVELFEARRHQTSAPPPNEKNDRKKLDAAKAIDRPNTIWMRRRKPPLVSPKASVKPVAMMMMPATILATGPSMDWRICCKGCSHGIDEPDAWAAGASMRLMARADAA